MFCFLKKKSIQRTGVYLQIELLSRDQIFDLQIDLVSRDRIFDLEIVLHSADRIFDLNIQSRDTVLIRSAGRIFDLEIEFSSFDTFSLI